MKKITNYSLLTIFFLCSVSIASFATDKINVFTELVTALDKTSANGNLPDIINIAGDTRGAGFNGEHVFVASRQNGDHVYYWDVNDPAEVNELEMPAVLDGYFKLADLTVSGKHIFASNMVFAGGTFKVYHWNDVDAQPTTLISYPAAPVRLGDAFTVLGNPDWYAFIVVSSHGGKSFYVWEMELGVLKSPAPEIITLAELDYNLNFSRVTLIEEEEYALVSGPGGLAVLDDIDVVLQIPQSFFPGWPMYANVFNYMGGRYLAYMHVKSVGTEQENVLYVLDLNNGEDALEALTNLTAGTFAERVLHSYNIGSNANGNASVSMDVVFDLHGNLWLMGFAAGNGFVVQKLGDAFTNLLPFYEGFDGDGPGTPSTWLPEEWQNIDADGDESTWYWETSDKGSYMISNSKADGKTALTPDNWLITPPVNLRYLLPNEGIELAFAVASTAATPALRAESYEVLISVDGDDPASFFPVWQETLPTEVDNWVWQETRLDLTPYQGNIVYLAFRHYGSTNMDRIALDFVDIQVIESIPAAEDLTLNVRMKVWADLGKFDPENDFVDIAGTFNEWGANPLVLTPLNDEYLTYTITIEDLDMFSLHEFKFRINGSWSDATAEFPFSGPNRMVIIIPFFNDYTFWYNDDEPTSISEQDHNRTLVFPNPASRQFTITSESRIQKVIITDVAGRTIKSINVDDFEFRMSTDDFKNGIYILGIYDEKGVTVRKLQVLK